MAAPTPLGERVRNLRKARQLTQQQLAQRVGVSRQTVWNWENGAAQVPSADLPELARALSVTVADFYAGDGVGPPTLTGIDRSRASPSTVESPFNVRGRVDELRAPGARRLPIYRWGAAGDPRDRESGPDPDREELPPPGRESVIGPNGFGVEVAGDSMVARGPHGIYDGDIVWVNPDRSPRLGGVVVALVDDGQGETGIVVKTWARTEVGECLLSETADGKTPVVCREFKIIGRVVWIQRGFPPD